MTKNDSSAILDVESHGLAEAEQVAPLFLIDRFGGHSAATMRLPSWLSRDRPVFDFLGGAACLLLWEALWSLLFSALVRF